MQLRRRGLGRISRALGALTANLFIATGAMAAASDAGLNDDTESPLGKFRLDTAVLVYQEAASRVRAVERVASLSYTSTNGDVLSLKATTDILTGATPNGAVPSTLNQPFVTPTRATATDNGDRTVTVTGASGGSTIVTIPGTGVIARQYTAKPDTLPVDPGFADKRLALDLAFAKQLGSKTRVSLGLSGSKELDFQSVSANAGIARDFNDKNTTVSLAINYERDLSRPFFGTPTPLTEMNPFLKGPGTHKSVASVVVGVTQVINRYWLAQANYSLGSTRGDQTDPYRIITVVDPVMGQPLQYLYESRPRARLRQSLYAGSKVAVGRTVLDLSARAYHDNWGLSSITAEVSDRLPLSRWLYVQPQVRYYRQTAAHFFHNYLVGGEPIPDFASSDYRLSAFSATTLGLKLGLKLGHYGEVFILAENYRQWGDKHPHGAYGDLAKLSLFTGVRATNLAVGFSVFY